MHLHTSGPLPTEYLTLLLCRDVYHCTPVELAQVPLHTILEHLTCMEMEDKVRRLRQSVGRG